MKKLAKKSVTLNLSADEVKNNKFDINRKDIGKFFPQKDKEIKLIFGMTEISGKIKGIVSTEKKKKVNYFIQVSQNLNLMVGEKIKLIKLSEDTYEIQKI